MSVTIGTIATNGKEITKQAWSFDRSGLIRLTETWLVNTADVLTVLPAYQSAHATFTSLFYQGSTGTSLPLGLSSFTLIYEGAGLSGGGGSTDTTPNYFATTGTMQVPISQHPEIDNWIYSEVAAGRDPRDVNEVFQAFRFGAVSSGTNSLYGLTSYEVPTVIWNKEWVSTTDPDAAEVETIGTVQTPDGSPPTPTNTNWLLIENSWRKLSATMFSRVKRWKLSQPNAWGGWNTDVY